MKGFDGRVSQGSSRSNKNESPEMMSPGKSL